MIIIWISGKLIEAVDTKKCDSFVIAEDIISLIPVGTDCSRVIKLNNKLSEKEMSELAIRIAKLWNTDTIVFIDSLIEQVKEHVERVDQNVSSKLSVQTDRD